MNRIDERRTLGLPPALPVMRMNENGNLSPRYDEYGRTRMDRNLATRRVDIGFQERRHEAARQRRMRQMPRGRYAQQRMRRRRGTGAQQQPRQQQPQNRQPEVPPVPEILPVAEEVNLYKQLLNLNEEQRNSQYNALIEDDKSQIRGLCNNLIPIAPQVIGSNNENIPVVEAFQMGGRRKRQRKKRTKKKSRKKKRKTLKKKRKRRKKKRKTRR